MKDDVNPILNYARRIGAVEKNFRRWVILEDDPTAYIGGKRVVATITLAADGTIKTSDPAFDPTDAEQQAIKEEVARKPFPKSIAATKASMKDRMKGIDPAHYCVFWDETGKNILLIQHRKDGEKPDLPITYWSDGIWRTMEPDGPLPLFGLERLNNASTVFLHEGAKGARDVQAIVNDKVGHPWAKALGEGVHVGWPGGINRTDDVDFQPIKKLPPRVRVIMVADHDQGGEDAIAKVSRRLLRSLSAIRFGDAFPDTFDLADPFPSELWREKKGHMVYVGPSLEDCLSPATWATKVVSHNSKGVPIYGLRDEFAKEWIFSVKPKVFVNRANLQRRYSEEEFNTRVAPFADIGGIGRLIHKRPSCAAETLAYEPGERPGLIAVDREHVINIYQPSRIRPAKGDVAPWEEFLEYMVPVKEDLDHLKKWCATLIARPDVRMKYAMLLVSETQGVGKTTFAEILAVLVGKHNTSFPSAHEATQGSFSSWRVFKRLAIIAELYDGETVKAYNRLKSAITDNRIRCEEKYETPFDVNNYVHIIASSNSMRALKIDNTDRRWFMPGITEKKRPHSKWAEFYSWLEDGGLEKICWWAQDYVKINGHVIPGVEAPESIAKKQSIVASMSDGERLVHELGTRLTAVTEARVVRLDKLRSWLATKKSADRRYGDGSKYLETPETISRVLRQCGLKALEKRFMKDKDRFRIMANFDVDPATTWESLEPMCLTPEEIYALDLDNRDTDSGLPF